MKAIHRIILLLALSLSSLVARADRFVATTTASIGSKINLTLQGANITLTGLEGTVVYDEESSYTVTAQTFTIEGDLIQVYCYACNISSIDLSECPNLQGLGCQGNQLTSLDLSACKSLSMLFCESNPLKRLDVSSCPELGRLNCVQCDLEELILTGCSKLFEISCYQNKLTELDLTDLKGLIWLYCFDNQLKEIDTSHCPLMMKVLCEYNQISKLDFSQNHELDEVACQGNNLKGTNLTAICETLPDRTEAELKGIFMVVDTKSDQNTNVCTVEQVALLKSKGWNAMNFSGGANRGFGVPYEGSKDDAIEVPNSSGSLRLSVGATTLSIEQLPLGATVIIYDISGAVCYQLDSTASTRLDLSIEGWRSGAYLLTISGRESHTIFI